MNHKHLYWIIPLCIIIAWSVGFYIGIPKNIDIMFNITPEMSGMLDQMNNITKLMGNCTR